MSRIKYASLKNMDKYQVRSKILSSLNTIQLAAQSAESSLDDRALLYVDLQKISEAAKFIILQAHAIAQLAAEKKTDGKGCAKKLIDGYKSKLRSDAPVSTEQGG